MEKIATIESLLDAVKYFDSANWKAERFDDAYESFVSVQNSEYKQGVLFHFSKKEELIRITVSNPFSSFEYRFDSYETYVEDEGDMLEFYFEKKDSYDELILTLFSEKFKDESKRNSFDIRN